MKDSTRFVFIIFFSIIVNLASCDIGDQNKIKITEGKYVFNMDCNVYIEILNQRELYFHNIDFSSTQAYLDGMGVIIDVKTQLDMKKHNFDITAYALYVFVTNVENFGDLYLTIPYSNEEQTLTYGHKTFLLDR
ncbi:hypothetical protein R84B8_01611 [Treponema sp. R8-4-B8]